MNDRTVPFFKVRRDDRNEAIQKMKDYTGGDPSKLTTELVKTAFKSLVGSPGSQILGVPRVVESPFGPTLRISLKNSPVPAFTSLAQLRSFM